MLRLVTATLLCSLVAPRGAAAATDLFDGLAGEWRAHWREEKFFTKPTLYRVVTDEDGQTVLHASSSAAHAGLVREVRVPSPTRAMLGWRWKIQHSLKSNTRERTRGGDDYAARVIVVFETSLFPFGTRAINYVWAAGEPVGAVYPSPYSRNVGMVVLRSGDADAGQWREERRDVLADYRRYFGETAARITAVAVLVDTDNTGAQADAWFSNLSLTSTSCKKP